MMQKKKGSYINSLKCFKSIKKLNSKTWKLKIYFKLSNKLMSRIIKKLLSINIQ